MSVDILVNIDVEDVARAVAFYTDAFGLRVGRRFGEDSVELLGGTVAICLLQKNSGSAAAKTTSDVRRYQRHWTPVHLDIAVADIDTAVARAASAGAVLEEEISTFSWGRLAQLADPFGNGFCLIEFLGRGYDEIASS